MKRRLLIATIFLLAGAVVNVAVAWRCAAWIGPAKLTWVASLYTECGGALPKHGVDARLAAWAVCRSVQCGSGQPRSRSVGPFTWLQSATC
ncbi:MAG: hypothetical protein V3T53_00195 [Phycisphaerales bacterium]